jgi:hypothetical protein
MGAEPSPAWLSISKAFGSILSTKKKKKKKKEMRKSN